MSNTHIIDSLSTLFSMSTTAVLGAQEQFIAFMNPAAQELSVSYTHLRAHET